MNSWFLPFAVIASTSKERRQRLTETLLPAVVPLAETHRVAVAVVAADQQVRSAERREENVANEVVSAIQTVVAKQDQNKTLTDDELRVLPRLSEVVNRVPDLRQRISSVGTTATDVEDRFAREAVEAVVLAFGKASGDKLTDEELIKASPSIHRALQRLPDDVRGKIVKPKAATSKASASSSKSKESSALAAEAGT
jgi:hypothetical protein